jgi:hypothetical protein
VVPTVFVSTIYPGASPEDIENLITKPLEKEIKSVSGIKKITSNSIQDFSLVVVEFNTGIDVDIAKQKISNAVDKAKTELPSDMKRDPDVQEVNFSEFPIMNINVNGDFPLDQLKNYTEDLKDDIEQLPEITRCDMIGALTREVQVNVDLYRMQALGISFGDIERSVASENVNISGGEIRIEDLRRTMRVTGEFATVDEIGNIIIRSARGNLAYLKDIAEVKDGYKDKQDFARLDGKPVIHHGRQYQVMTNSPTFAEQLTLNNYWKRLDGSKTLPGSHQSQDRFVRASYYVEKLPQAREERQQVAGILSVMRNVSVPWGEPDPQHPNIAPTYWRTVLDHSRRVYYFESALSPNVVWVNLNEVDFSPGSGIRAVALEGAEGFALMGKINTAFKPADNINYLMP